MKWPGIRLAIGERPPWYMGLAWREPHVDQYVLYPVPLNLIARYGRNLWEWARQGGSWRRALDDAFWKGYLAGKATKTEPPQWSEKSPPKKRKRGKG